MIVTSRFAWLAALVLPLLSASANALTLSTSTLAMAPGEIAKVTVSNIKGSVSLTNSNSTVVSATLASNTVTVTAKTVGSATLSLKDRRGTKTIAVTVKAPMSVSPTSLSIASGQTATLTVSSASGSISVSSSDYSKISVSLSGNVISVTGKEVGEAKVIVRDQKTQLEVPVTVTSGGNPPPPTGGNTDGRLLASNCFQCHGTNGTGGFDRIAGKSASELLSELRKFATGAEGNGIMAAHATGYTDAQMQAIANYLATQ